MMLSLEKDFQIVGTAQDPQGLDAQKSQLEEAGIEVFPTNAAAARHALALVQPDPQ